MRNFICVNLILIYVFLPRLFSFTVSAIISTLSAVIMF